MRDVPAVLVGDVVEDRVLDPRDVAADDVVDRDGAAAVGPLPGDEAAGLRAEGVGGRRAADAGLSVAHRAVLLEDLGAAVDLALGRREHPLQLVQPDALGMDDGDRGADAASQEGREKRFFEVCELHGSSQRMFRVRDRPRVGAGPACSRNLDAIRVRRGHTVVMVLHRLVQEGILDRDEVR